MDIESTIDHFFAAWNAQDHPSRTAAVQAAFAEDARLTDPLGDVTGHSAIAEFIDTGMQQFPGHRFRRTSSGDVHHDLVRFSWTLCTPDGVPVIEGLEIGAIGADGRLARTVGFFGPLASIDEVAA